MVLDNVKKAFGDTIAVNNMSLEVFDKEFLVLLGPSGCGKTTTLRMIAGLEKPTKGTVLIDGKDVTYQAPKDRDIAMVFQSYALYPHMKVYDNIAFPLKMHRYSKKDSEEKVKKAADLLGITHLLPRKPRQLSGGEAQRVALGRAIVREPKVFLMDEPLSNLDAKLRVHMRAELKALQKELGTTMIYVTHDQLEALTMSDRIALMNKGVIEQLGDGNDLFFKPATYFTASFIGSPPMNFLECSYVEKNHKAYLQSEGFNLDVTDFKDTIKQGATSTELIFGVRPEDITVSTTKPTKFDALAEVYITEPAGSEMIVNLRLEDCKDTYCKVKTRLDPKIQKGNRLWLKLDMNQIHIFDKKTEKAIV
ncbi:ABC transporter ATP-binding protein [[Eubacterium] cellulosolvens]